jgi:hypothetical protein
VEGQERCIAIHHDPPQAIEAMLRFIYGFPYERIVELSGTTGSLLDYHIQVMVTAQKYLVTPLQDASLRAIQDVVGTLKINEGNETINEDRTRVFQAIKGLAAHADDFDELHSIAQKLSKDHLPALVRLDDFRAWLEENRDYGLEDMVKAVDAGYRGVTDVVYVCKRCGGVFHPKAVPTHNCLGQIRIGWEAYSHLDERTVSLR